MLNFVSWELSELDYSDRTMLLYNTVDLNPWNDCAIYKRGLNLVVTVLADIAHNAES